MSLPSNNHSSAALALLECKRQIDQDWNAIYNDHDGILPSLKTVLRLYMPRWAINEIVNVLAEFCASFQKVCSNFVQINNNMTCEEIITAMYINIKARMDNGMIRNNKQHSVRRLRNALCDVVKNVHNIQATSTSEPVHTEKNGGASKRKTYSELARPVSNQPMPQTAPVLKPVTPISKPRSTFNSAEARASALATQFVHPMRVPLPPVATVPHNLPSTLHPVLPWAGPGFLSYDDDEAELPYLETEKQTNDRARAVYFEEARNKAVFDNLLLRQTGPSAVVDGFFSYNPQVTTRALHDEWLRQELVQIDHQETVATNHAERQEAVWGSQEYHDWHNMNRSLEFSAGRYVHPKDRPNRLPLPP